MDVSVIIVNYNTCALTLQCLRTLYEETYGVSFEVIVVDNASKDDSVEKIRLNFPEVILIESPVNLGFGRANNKGVDVSQGKYLFFLNSDTILISNIIKTFFHYLEGHPEYVSCGGNLLDARGRNSSSHGCFPSLMCEFSNIGFRIFYNRFYIQHLALGQTAYEGNISSVHYISGADMFIRKDIFQLLNGFDENIFMYYEETDLYYRMNQAGFKSCILPYACLIHLEGGSFDGVKPLNLNRFKMILESKLYFFRKHFGKNAVMWVRVFSFISVLSHCYLYKKLILSYLSIILKH